ncbi:hypothetical protein MNBD_ALPHA06-460 [hydrothermal vent metagenome]|uniref:DNA-directed DNA polymerase n=1 Tax=hydrothermal vent metagenome TaxID=652676 RepID=A0A3B0R771_9ZZZZ
MKQNASGFDRFIKRPDKQVYAALVFGNDQGQVSERASSLKKTWLGKDPDPFALSLFCAGELAANQGSLADELNAYSMSGGARLVQVKHPAAEEVKQIIAVIKAFDTEQPSPVAHLLVEAAALNPSSALRKAFETSKSHAIALACYPDKAGDVASYARNFLRDAGHSIQPDALALLVDSVPRDQRILRLELEKLVCYIADQPGIVVETTHIQAIICQAGDASLDDLVFSCTEGNGDAADQALQRALEAGQAPVMIVRAIARHLYRLHEVTANMQNGAGVSSAMAKLRPPVFIMHRQRFTRQCQRWSPARLQTALAQAIQTERALKSNAAAANSRLGRYVLAVAAVSH